MPEVGLERDSKPCHYWEVAETCGIRANPMGVRASPRWKVWTLSTLPFCPVGGRRIAAHFWENTSHLGLYAKYIVITGSADRDWARNPHWFSSFTPS